MGFGIFFHIIGISLCRFVAFDRVWLHELLGIVTFDASAALLKREGDLLTLTFSIAAN